MTITSPGKDSKHASSSRQREWTPRMWEGCNFLAWLRLLARNRFAVQLPYLYIAVIVTFVSLIHTLLRWLQELWFGGRVKCMSIQEAPLFIIGHWRTGTTLLHELLILDERHTCPSTFQCLMPNHFLLTEHYLARWLWFLMPAHRPMDNMTAGWDRPQEDEFALCMIGQPSPYLKIAFPNRPSPCPETLDLEGMTPRALASWKRAYAHYLRQITFKDPRRLILKSPPHSCRIKVLLELFPDARFVHIVRDPYVIFPSTVNLWKTLYQTHGLQRPTFDGLEEDVFNTFTHLYERVEKGKALIDPSRFCELRYEELIRDPVGEMRKLYEHLQLGGFDKVLPRLEQYLSKITGYKRNHYELTPELRAEITRRWGDVIRKYGYSPGKDEG